MCISDWQLGRLVSVQKRWVDLSVAPLTLGASTTRVAIGMYSVEAVPDSYLTIVANGLFRQFVNLTSAENYIEFNIADHGDWIQHRLRFLSNNAPDFLLINEYTMPLEYLAVEPNTFDVSP